MAESNAGVHLRHCYQGENEGFCKYGEADCPAAPPLRAEIELQMIPDDHVLMKTYRFGRSMAERGLTIAPDDEPWALNEAFAELEALISKRVKEAIEQLLPPNQHFPSITSWRQGEFIDMPQYSHMGQDWKDTQRMTEKRNIRFLGGTSNGVTVNGMEANEVVAYLEQLGRNIEKALEKGSN